MWLTLSRQSSRAIWTASPVVVIPSAMRSKMYITSKVVSCLSMVRLLQFFGGVGDAGVVFLGLLQVLG